MEPVIPLTLTGSGAAQAAAVDARLQDLLDRYGGLLRRTVGRVCPRELGLSCDDIEQQARLGLWTALKREREIEFPASYIYKVAVSATLRAIRQARARREDQLPDDGFEEGVSPAGPSVSTLAAPSDASPHAMAERGELARTIEAEVAQLAPPRDVAVKLHLRGLTTREIGNLVGWTEAKARNLVHRGLKDLRPALRARGIEYRPMTIKISDDDLRTIWQKRAAAAPADRSECLTDVEWARLLSKEAAAAERTRAVAHISSCTQCAEEFSLLQPLQEWSADVERALAPPAAPLSHRWTAWLSSFSSPLPAFAMAAALILMVTQGVGVYLLVGSRRANTQLATQLSENQHALSTTQTSVAALEEQLRNRPIAAEEQLKSLQQRLAQQSTPQLDAVIADLDPQGGGAVRGSTNNQVLTIGSDGSIVTLILNFEPLGSRSALEVQITDKSGRILWTGRTERDRATAMLTMTLPPEGYPPGSYVIDVFDATRGRRLLATYSLTLQRSR